VQTDNIAYVGEYEIILQEILPNEESLTKLIKFKILDPNDTSSNSNQTDESQVEVEVTTYYSFPGVIINMGPPRFIVESLGTIKGKEMQESSFVLPRYEDPDGDPVIVSATLASGEGLPSFISMLDRAVTLLP